MRRVVITGFGAYTPIGNTEKEIKESFYQGKSGTVFIPEWKEIKAISPDTYKRLMKTPLVYDGRNIYDVDVMKENGIEYYSIGRI